jgi:hypothetical protein
MSNKALWIAFGEKFLMGMEAAGSPLVRSLLSYLMKYPDTLHWPSLSSMGVTVSTADFLLAKLVSY